MTEHNNEVSMIKGFTEDTEILTVDGFRTFNELCIGDDVYTYEDGLMMTDKVQSITSENFRGNIHRYKGRDIIYEASPSHHLFHQKNNSKDTKHSSSLVMFSRRTPTYFPVSFKDNPSKPYPISNDLLELLTIIICDGSIKTANQIRISKSPRRYGQERIEELLRILNIRYYAHNGESNFETALRDQALEKWGDKKYPIRKYTLQDVGYIVSLLDGTKTVLPKFFTKLSKQQSELVINTWVKFDGHVAEKEYNRKKLQVDNYTIADQLSHICIRACVRPYITQRIIGDNKSPTIHVLVHQRDVKVASIKEEYFYSGVLWAPVVSGKTVMFRHKGYVFLGKSLN